MKILCFLTLAAATLSFAQLSGQNVSLPKPNLDKGYSITKSLSLRKSAEAQDFQKAKDLSLEEISELLWAANGVNRPAEGRRTAPSAMNSQDIYLYVLAKGGAYLYNAKEHSLSLVASGDLRAAGAGGQKAFGDAPIIVVLVSDISKLKSGGEKLGAMDAGIVSQNISLFCSGTGLITRVRASMDVDALTKALKLNASQIPMLNHPVGK